MIIQCPNCGYSGRIPSYALGTPHNAKCPKCRFRFELGSLLLEPMLEKPGSQLNPGLSLDAPIGDPGSSAYELKAITDDFGPDGEWDSAEDRWEDYPDRRPFTVNERGSLRSPDSAQAPHPT